MAIRILLSFLSAFICSNLLLAQSDSKLYFDHYWEETGIDNAAYYRLHENTGRSYRVRDYYISGKLQMEGTYTSLSPEIQDGYFIWYYENGQKYAEGNYVHGERDGIWTFWFPDGLKKQEIRFYPGRAGEFAIKWESRRLKNSMEMIQRAVNERKEKALALLNSAIQANPYCAEAYYEKGLIELKRGEKDVACEDLLKAREYWFPDMIELNRVIEENCGRPEGTN